MLIARATFGRSERLYSSCRRARSSAVAPFAARARGFFPTSLVPLCVFFLPSFLGCEGWKLEESELLCCGFFSPGLLGRGSGCEAGEPGEPDARMRRAAALSPEHLSACWSEHDRRLVQMPMPDFAASEQR
ncbi:hypothetical protein PHYPO_G00090120 [Pangasianodon hypophthalmus]|uniref:Uncharacterized protein n=1 Tax=Pangasianodon hypophthalmus TaxID=310915 RepID=A0A5N5LHX7_PANHP|nr:hypothetical protein PHYPO_G00090120 [Pangasianodon hypophthalmus]